MNKKRNNVIVKPGFLLLEMVIGTLIASMISMVLMNTLGYMTKMSAVVENMADQALQISIVQHQFEKDVMGMCVVNQAVIEDDQDEQKKNKSVSTEQKENSGEQKEQQSNASLQKKERVPRLKKLFFVSIGQENQMQQVSFITNNPLPQFWQGSVGNAKPLRVRVVYFLKPDPQHQGSFMLMRQESTDLLIESFKDKVPAYVVADHIASFSFTLSYDMVQKEEAKDQKNQKQAVQKNKTTTSTITHWDTDDLLTKENEYYSLLP